jgi:hypothetical protein
VVDMRAPHHASATPHLMLLVRMKLHERGRRELAVLVVLTILVTDRTHAHGECRQ